MSEYFDAFVSRLKSNTETIKNIGYELIESGCTVLITKDQNVSFLIAVKNGAAVYLQFEECPYGWSISYFIKPSQEKGSSVRINTRYDPENPYTSKEILSCMVTLYEPQEKFIKDKLRYLKELKLKES